MTAPRLQECTSGYAFNILRSRYVSNQYIHPLTETQWENTPSSAEDYAVAAMRIQHLPPRPSNRLTNSLSNQKDIVSTTMGNQLLSFLYQLLSPVTFSNSTNVET